LVQAEQQHRGRAVIEQLLADLNDGPLAHLPSGKFTANAAWLAVAAIARNLVRAAGAIAGRRHAKARAATVRCDLVAVAARTERRRRGLLLTLRLPEGWHVGSAAQPEAGLRTRLLRCENTAGPGTARVYLGAGISAGQRTAV